MIVLGSSLLMLTGCADPNASLVETSPSAGKKLEPYNPTAAAGIGKDVSKSLDPGRLQSVIAATARFRPRANPFALNPSEKAFDKAQMAERFLSEDGNFGSQFEIIETAPPGEGEVPEPQPYRRLSGIVIGDAVLAIIEENGVSRVIRPGEMIPNTNWRVVSIDREKAILRRVGSNRLPREIEVRLETAPPSALTGGGGGGAPIGGVPGGRGGGGDTPAPDGGA
ncbi:MAG TPA: hypothetical protein VK171_05165 [Fimbriimonas sp.]|nr:hypothetical protein [Fimbriimonas sp.]